MFDVDPVLLENYKKTVDISTLPRSFQKWWTNASAEERNDWYTERFKCLKYHLYLAGFAKARSSDKDPSFEEIVPTMGMDFQDNPHTILFKQFLQKRPGEGLVLSDLDTQTKKRMILWPRGLFKTSAIIVEIVQLILNYPNIRICFLTGGDKLALRQLGRVKRVFEKPTKRFKSLFPEFCLKDVRNVKIANEADERAWSSISPKMGTKYEFTIPCRTTEIFAEPTFAISTARSVKAGSHYDVIIVDDLVNEQNFRKVEALEKCWEDYLAICPVLEPSGFMLVTGTRYSFGDTYERIQDASKEEEKLLGKTIWKFSIRDCWSFGCKHCGHSSAWHDFDVNIVQGPCIAEGCTCCGYEGDGVKNVLFPQVRTRDGRSIGHTLEFLEGEKIRLGEAFFANQYENKPIATEAQTFTQELIDAQTLFHPDNIPSFSISTTFIIGDLAYVGQEGRDYSVLFAVRKYMGQLFIFDCDYGNWDAAAIAEHSVRFMMKHRPNIMYFEQFNGWDAYHNGIVAYAKTLNIEKVPIEWRKGSQAPKAKLARIGSAKSPLKNRRLWLFAPMPGFAILTNQLVKWPKLGRHDDFADCCGMTVEAPTGYQLEAPPPPESQLEWLRRMNPANAPDDDYGDNGCGTGINC